MLLLCTRRFLHLKAKTARMILASVLGGVLSLTALLPPLPFFLNFPLDFLGAAALVFTAFGKTNFKNFLKRTAVLFSVSFSFCGMMVLVYTSFHPKGMEVYNDVVYFNISPVLLIILTLVCYYAMRLTEKLTKGRLGKQVCRVTVTTHGKTAEFSAMIDTGCEVKEPFSGEYVIIAEESCLTAFNDLFFQYRIIPFNSLGGSGILSGFRAEKIWIDGRELSNQIYIGKCSGALTGDVKAIVPYAITKNLNVRS